ncbi:MAG: hypothetical protein IJP79_06265 [Paludibacteraceae bacterium]|nr:hypothetical protein [Paludibacteraceae bacterium]
MKKRILFVCMALGLAILASSCSKTSGIESDAEDALEKKLDKSVNSSVSKIEKNKVFLSDSLCIFHVLTEVTSKLPFDIAPKYEYIYMINQNNAYESFSLLSDSVYMTKEEYEQDKKGKIYENVKYEDFIYNRAVQRINEEGNLVGDDSGKPVELKLSLKTGLWELKSYMDEFGEASNEKYICVQGTGTSNDNVYSDYYSYLFVDSQCVSIKLAKYGINILNENTQCTLKIKDAKGEVLESKCYVDGSGCVNVHKTIDFGQKMMALLQQEGSLVGNIENYSSWGMGGVYQFKINIDGYNEASKFIK